MRLLYLSYWGLEDGLTQATVLPHVEILDASSRIDHIVFATVERAALPRFVPSSATTRVRHVALPASRLRPGMLARMADFVSIPRALARLAERDGVTMILARGAPAGALAHLTQAHRRTPYIVESFEPHAEYMREAGAWAPWDPRYILQRRWETAQKKEALLLMPVAEAFRERLVHEGVDGARILTLPCTVDAERFAFNSASRARMRHEWGIGATELAGIYAGKFGDNYYGVEAFDLFAAFARRLTGFRMVVLTPSPLGEVLDLARQARFAEDRLILRHIPHQHMPEALAAADVAFATIRMSPSRKFCSPIKVGEYWASGLPIVITAGVGDDADIVLRYDAGAVVDLTPMSVDTAIGRITALLQDGSHRVRIAGLARTFRSRDRVRSAYQEAGLL